MPVTMQDIAKDVHVSVVTVSKVLRNQGRISEATRQLVLRRAKELNYQMNWVARSLVTRRTFTIGLLLPEFAHPFFAEIARAISQIVRPKGYHLLISSFDEDPAAEASEVDSLLARRVDGLIIASAQPARQTAMFQRMRHGKTPYVLIDRPISGVRACFVGVDHVAIGEMATEHLITRGCQRIAHLRGPSIRIAAERMEGYRRALLKTGHACRKDYVVGGGRDADAGYQGMKQLLQMSPRPDGVFCFNDPVAIGAMKAILQGGLTLPKDVALVGAGNVRYSDVLAVPLTTIDQAPCRIGELASELLLAQMASKKALPAKRVMIPPKLVERESTRQWS
jgi:LacI family transcriptional regulator